MQSKGRNGNICNQYENYKSFLDSNIIVISLDSLLYFLYIRGIKDYFVTFHEPELMILLLAQNGQ